MKRYGELVKKNEERYMEELFRFLSQKSISATGEGMTETVDMLQVFMEDAGIETRLLSTDGWPALYGEIGDPADGSCLPISRRWMRGDRPVALCQCI